MKASETNFQSLIEGAKQYIVPLFQRPYSWQKKEWQDLLNDINDLYESEGINTHFIGSIVTMPTLSRPENITPYLLIDGQQRLTTIFILLILLRDLAKSDGKRLGDKIHDTLITNQYVDNLEHFKLLPTQQDRADFLGLVTDSKDVSHSSSIVECYMFFKQHIRKLDYERLNQVIANRLAVVSIVLESDDNPYIVFESLNAKGRSLTQADLIRNYFFMKIDLNQQEVIYTDYWLPMQTALKENLTEFMRHYLASDGVIVKKDEVYLVLKQKVDKHKDAFAELNRIKQFSDYYEKIINPEKEGDLGIRNGITRIKCLKITVLYPFLLNCYHGYTEENLSVDKFLDILATLENYFIRRFVCNVQTRGLNKVLPLLYHQALKNSLDLAEGVRSYLQSQNYPKDHIFRECLISSALYGNGDCVPVTKLILTTLENSIGNKEKILADDISVERILPQMLSKEWEQHWDGEDYDLYLNTLGNLTITSLSCDLSNEPFHIKKSYFKLSSFSLNSYFEFIDKWDKDAIEKRAEYLADNALKIWSYFGSYNQVESSENLRWKKPVSITILGDEYPVKHWYNVIVILLDWIIDYEPDAFLELINHYPHFMSKNLLSLRQGKILNNGYYIETNLSADIIYRLCNQMIQFAGLSSDDWKIDTD